MPEDNSKARSKPRVAAKKSVEDEWDDLGFGDPDPGFKKAGTTGAKTGFGQRDAGGKFS